jgi:hypothetical protein
MKSGSSPAPISHHDGKCLDGGNSSTLKIHVAPGRGSKDFSWPPLKGGAALDFVLPKAILAIAPGCVDELGLTANADNGPGTERNLWVGRLDEAPTQHLSLGTCGCGAAIFLGGSGGNTGDNLRFMRHLAANGYSTISPDSMASTDADSYPRHRDQVPDLDRALAGRDTYWCSDELYTGKCQGRYEGGQSAGCFSSKSENIRYDPAAWAAYYERVYEMRRLEVSHASCTHLPDYSNV